jgi:hypothetical protein
MPTIGTITVNLFSTDKDETVYARAGNNLSHTDVIALRRTLPKTGQPLRTNMRFERGFPVTLPTGTVEKPVTVSIAITAPAGVVPADVVTYITEACTQGAASAASLGTTGDIHIG